ncbi:hypothetical protein HELRODRAFT_113396 [Helobdella robusta]|uniref:C2H2-type domain-containing protein n=1 Tax=Helobdella robusta TaxID=6412 RepID=T1EFS2_HELRO|nr:hypothetical protein HELRODRAFT_113396 [Helobdella robusta]ESN99984.1 hypothetical protein HELRODRAFT_113396 [Helobdella robusta]
MNFAMSGGIECFYFDASISENVEIGDNFSETVFVDGPCINVDTVAGAEKKSKSSILKSRGMITTCTENSFDPSPAPSQPQQSIQTTIKRPLLQFLNANNQQQTILIRFNNSNCKAQSQQDENCHAKSFLPLAGLGLKTCLDEMAKLKCRQCSYQACYGKQLEEHVSTLHSSEALDRCLCCQMIFFNDDDLKIHYQKNHPKCYCSECGFISQHGYVMRRHMQSHTEEGRKCMFCSKLYKDRYVLNMHLKMVHSPVEKSFTCTTCSKSFNRKAHLVRHERTHAPKKPFICHHPNCNYSASERSDLSKHSLVHGEPQFKCNVCSKKFRQSKNRDLHLKRYILIY